MKRFTPILSTIMIAGLTAPATAASLSTQDIKLRLDSQAITKMIDPGPARTDENDQPLSDSGYMAVQPHARIMLDVQFKVGSSTVTKQGAKQVTALCDAMQSMPSMPSLHLIGHTDRSGRAEKNLEVSQNRAAAVKNFIVTECELPGGLILTSGEGEAYAPTTGKANNADDRRIEVQLIGAPVQTPIRVETVAATSIESAPAKASKVLTTARGSFVGTKKFHVKGTTEVYREDGQWFIRLGSNFSESGAPDPKLALGNKAAGGYQEGTILGLIKANGESVYALKPGLDIGDYDQIWIWCERFNVPIGHADLTLL